jgi:hypothetical protein
MEGNKGLHLTTVQAEPCVRLNKHSTGNPGQINLEDAIGKMAEAEAVDIGVQGGAAADITRSSPCIHSRIFDMGE